MPAALTAAWFAIALGVKLYEPMAARAGCVEIGRPPVDAPLPKDRSGSLRLRMEAVLADCPRGGDLRYLQAISSPDFRADAHNCDRYLSRNPKVKTASVYEGGYTVD